ncbi:MAG: hypothetical protein VYB25_00260 [Pseudomonadota bacterium]|nr:hypothetical protein [Pseudomonadota bacterium]
MNTWQDARMLKLTGFGVKEFLQGYVTSNTERITANECTAFATCSLQGRVVANGWAIELTDGIGLVVHRSISRILRDYLQPYLQFSKCKLEPREDSVFVSSAQNEHGIPLFADWHLVIDPVESASTPDASTEINECLIDQQIVLLQQPCSAQHLPQMLALDKQGAVDFDKGCYLGQEVVARAQFRGAVKRRLDTFSLPAGTEIQVNLGESLTLEDTKGEVVMVGARQGLWVTRL